MSKIDCIACGISVNSDSEIFELWTEVYNGKYCCPNCDITIVDMDSNKEIYAMNKNVMNMSENITRLLAHEYCNWKNMGKIELMKKITNTYSHLMSAICNEENVEEACNQLATIIAITINKYGKN